MNCEKSEPIAFLLFFCFFVLSVNYNDLPQLLHKYINGIIFFFFFKNPINRCLVEFAIGRFFFFSQFIFETFN